MRIAGLFALAILLPITAYAALVNINTADAKLLDTLPEIGSVIAGRIISYRETNGPFTTVEGIQKVKGIGSGSTYAKIAPFITVGGTSVIASSTQSEKPNPAPTSYTSIQTARLDETSARQVEKITSPQANIQTHEEAVIAPTETVEPAAVGAVSPVLPELVPSQNTRASGLFHSPWTLGLLGVIVVAGTAFIFL